jgi:hypothetical protein
VRNKLRPSFLKNQKIFIILLSVFWFFYLCFMPLTRKFVPDVTIRLCGSTTLGERFAPALIEAMAKKNSVLSIESKQLADINGIDTTRVLPI